MGKCIKIFVHVHLSCKLEEQSPPRKETGAISVCEMQVGDTNSACMRRTASMRGSIHCRRQRRHGWNTMARTRVVTVVVILFAEKSGRELHRLCLVGIVSSACANESGMLRGGFFVHLFIEFHFLACLACIGANLPSRFVWEVEARAATGLAAP